MRKYMKQQLTLFTILFILMGCNNTPDAQQNSAQTKQQNESTVSTITEDASETMRINDDILAIDQKIADLENEEKLRLSKEIQLIQEKIANLEIQETEIDSAISKLEAQVAPAKIVSNIPAPSLAVTDTVIEKDATTAGEAETTKPQQVASINPNSVHGWGDWANGIQPAAGPAINKISAPITFNPPNPAINREVLQVNIANIKNAQLAAEAALIAAAEAARLAAAEAARLAAAEAARLAAAEAARLAAENAGGSLADGSGIIIVTPGDANRR